MSNIEVNEQYDEYKEKGQIEFVTFHPSYSYEDFIESIRPDLNAKDGTQRFVSYEGIFKKACRNALNSILEEVGIEKIKSWNEFEPKAFKEALKSRLDKDEYFLDSIPRFVLVIDEINRGDISKIFGELITLIEEDKRLGCKNDLVVTLPYTQQKFGIPPNLYIIGTMNTADRSLTSIDIALRRRFHFKEMPPEPEKLLENSKQYGISDKVTDDLKDSLNALIKLNEKLSKNPDIGRDKRIGHAFFCNISSKDQIESAWIHKIWPLLEEYYYFDKEALKALSGSVYTPEEGWKSREVKTFINKMNEQA